MSRGGSASEVLESLTYLLARARPSRVLDSVIGKAKAVYASGKATLNHVLAEVLIAHYLLSKGYDSVDIEHSFTSTARCDVYGVRGGFRLCVEIEFGFVPPEHALNPREYIVAKHVKKLGLLGRFVEHVAFAYPTYFIPPIPVDLLRAPPLRSYKRMAELIALARKYFGLSDEEIEVVKSKSVSMVFFFDFDEGRVREVLPQSMEILITVRDTFVMG